MTRRITLGGQLGGRLLGAILLLGLGAPALAQPTPERVEVGGGIMTVGFELKTTTHGDGPEGRTSAHSLMKYVIPKPGYAWSDADRATVERWGELSIAQRTAFFFKTYKGGHDSTNFVTDQARYPFLDSSVSWYVDMGLPHIEVRSKPYENPRQALSDMKALKSDVKETIAFHMHLRVPDTVAGAQGEALTEWLRRTSWAIALKRADYSSKTDFVLKSMDNQPINVEELNKALEAFSAENPRAEKDIIERRGIRVSRLGNGSDRQIDIEFRGLMRDTGRLEQYLRATAETFGNGGAGASKTVYDASHPMRDHSSNGVIQFRTFGWHGDGSWNPNELEWLADEVDRARARFGVNARIPDADLRAAVKKLATADTDAGKKMLLPSSFNWLFLPLEYDPALPEGVQAQVEAMKKEYTRKLVRLAERVHAGEFGQPLEIASRIRRILYDFMNEAYTDAGRTAKLFEWYETSVFDPKDTDARTKRWRQETGKDRAAEWASRAAEGQGFGPRRRAAANASAESPFPSELVTAELEAVRRGMLARLTERIASEADPTQKAALERGLARVRAASFVLVPSAEVFADAKGATVRLSHGLLNQVLAQTADLPGETRAEVTREVVGLIGGHEIAHVAGIEVERVADAEGVRAYEIARGPLSDDAIRSAVRVVTRPTGYGHWDNLLSRLKGFTRYGTEGGRLRNLEEARRGEDPLREFRRADGTLDWKRLGGSKALQEVGGLAHFGLALFLKELAMVAKTGDRSRIEEFFDGLLTTDFYKSYGLFVAGARVAEVGYVRYLQRFVRPRFVSSILKTNLVLAAGLALPQIAEGTFNGKAFAISLGSLGLSSAAVKTGVAGISWVLDLKRLKDTGTLARLGLAGSRFARVGGWFYSAAELAVVLYLADEVGQYVNDELDEAAAKDALREAGEAFFAALGDRSRSKQQVSDAADRYHAAWIDYRNYLYRPLNVEEARFAERLEGVARDAKLAADRRQAALDKLKKYPALARRVEAQSGSVERYAEHLVATDEAEIARKVSQYGESYDRARAALLEDVYDGDRRAGALLAGVEDADWLLLGGKAGAAGDPWSGRSDVFAGWGRSRAQSGLGSALERVSSNRLQAYEDERAVLEAAAQAAERAGLGERAALLRDLSAQVERTRAMDEQLAHGKSGVIDTSTALGIDEALRRARQR
ncbi:MAG: hypothetical protein AB7N76_34345 [Planctomycetota bacterium]